MTKFIYKTGNIFDSDADALVNPVNKVGVMGAGLAKQFKIRYAETDYFKDYQRDCKKKDFRVFCDTFDGLPGVINIPTKDHWKDPSTLDLIREGCEKAVECLYFSMLFNGQFTVAVPPLGCGLGGLNVEDVEPIVRDAWGDIKVNVTHTKPRADLSHWELTVELWNYNYGK